MNSQTLKRLEFPALPDVPVESDTEINPATLTITWQDLTDAFLSDFRGATRRSYRDAFSRFTSFCGIETCDFKSRGIDGSSMVTQVPDEDSVKAFRDSLLDTGHSPHTINAYLGAVRAFYRFLHTYIRKALRTGQISASRAGELQLLIEGVLTVRKVRASNAPGKLPTTINQSKDLLSSIPTETLPDIRDRAMIALILGCGLRRIEVARVLRRDIIHRDGQLILHIQQKGHHSKDAYVVIWPGVERMIRPWLTESPYKSPESPLFPSLSTRDVVSPGPGSRDERHSNGSHDTTVNLHDSETNRYPAGSRVTSNCSHDPEVDRYRAGLPNSDSHKTDCTKSRNPEGQPLTPRSISRIVRHRLDAIGLKDHSTHSLRHAFATIALSSDDVELRDVQHALGHSQVTTTERYVHQSNRLAGLPEKAVNDLVFESPD